MNPTNPVEDLLAGFDRAAQIKPGKPFLVVGQEVLTYGALMKRIGQLGRLYKEA